MDFRLDLGQISFNLVENAFATRRLALLATRRRFSTIDLGRAQNFERESDGDQRL